MVWFFAILKRGIRRYFKERMECFAEEGERQNLAMKAMKMCSVLEKLRTSIHLYFFLDDTITLYVAFNGTNYQVRRNSSSSSRDWSDQFSFDACLQANKTFDYPIYVFSAGGSPYWRQYISTNPSPPSSEYRTDYMFYVSSAPLARTITCYVLESGSVPVIKSCISKNAKLTGWRSTGITFHAWKSTRPGSPTKREQKPLNR